MRLGFALMGLLSGCIVGGGDGTWTFDDATSLYVSLGSGNIDVRPSTDASTVVMYDGGGLGRAARPDVSEDDAGSVSVNGRGALGGGSIEVNVVDGIPITALTDRGDIDVELESPADLDLCVGAGSVHIGLPPGAYAFDLDAGVGSISVDFQDDPSAQHTVKVCLGAGSIEVHAFDPAVITN